MISVISCTSDNILSAYFVCNSANDSSCVKVKIIQNLICILMLTFKKNECKDCLYNLTKVRIISFDKATPDTFDLRIIIQGYDIWV